MKQLWIGALLIASCTILPACQRDAGPSSTAEIKAAATEVRQWEPADETQAEALRAAHAELRDHLVAERWEDAAALYSDAGVARLEQLRQLALYGDRNVLQELSTIDLLYVLFMRKLQEPEALREQSVRELLAWCLENKLLGPHWRRGDTLTKLALAGDSRAKGQRVWIDGMESNLPVYFDREGGQWRISLDGEFVKQEDDFAILQNNKEAAPPAQMATVIYEIRTMSKLSPEVFEPPFELTE